MVYGVIRVYLIVDFANNIMTTYNDFSISDLANVGLRLWAEIFQAISHNTKRGGAITPPRHTALAMAHCHANTSPNDSLDLSFNSNLCHKITSSPSICGQAIEPTLARSDMYRCAIR